MTSSKYRCDAATAELWSHTLGARSIYWVRICGCGWKWKMIIAVNFTIYAIAKKTLLTCNMSYYLLIQFNTRDFSTRMWGINPSNSVVTSQSLILRSIVLGWISIQRKWSIGINYLTIRLRARVFYEQIVNEAQPSWLSQVENEGE